MPEPIAFEILWLNEPEDTRPGSPGNLLSVRTADVTIIRRQNLTRACIYAANELRKTSHTGFVVRRQR